MANIIIRIDLGTAGRIGPGKIMLLERVDDHGSISAAARSMSMSYRQAWELIDQLNTSFKDPLVSSKAGGKSGGGARLTDFGRRILADLKALQAEAEQATAARLKTLERALKILSGAKNIDDN